MAAETQDTAQPEPPKCQCPFVGYFATCETPASQEDGLCDPCRRIHKPHYAAGWNVRDIPSPARPRGTNLEMQEMTWLLAGFLASIVIGAAVVAVMCITAERHCQCRINPGKCRSLITGDDMLCDRCRVGRCGVSHAIQLKVIA